MSEKPILCVDFDGVIHKYDTAWTDAVTISDGPVPGALRWLWEATKVFDVQVYSSRSKTPSGRVAMRLWMEEHAIKELGEDHPLSGRFAAIYPVTFSHEKPPAFLTIDDRAVCFLGDFAALDLVKLRQFKPWNKNTVTLK